MLMGYMEGVYQMHLSYALNSYNTDVQYVRAKNERIVWTFTADE
jgi:hypothetical protein